MSWLAYIILIFTLMQLLIALVNFLSHTHLPYTGRKSIKKISVLIPARDEEKNIRNILNDLRLQNSENIEVIVFNDQSCDKTESIVREFTVADSRFRLLDSAHLPPGWLGKNYACHNLAHEASGEYLLFLDADVRISGNLIGDAVAYADQSRSDLVSIFPKQIILTAGEWATVPNMNYILVTLLPLVLVRKSRFSSLSAANGQFMLFRHEIYRKYSPHKLLKSIKVEDILIARFFKKNGLSVSCMLGDERISCRMYNGFRESVNGFSKNVAEFFGGSYIVTIIFWLITTFGFIAVLILLPIEFLLLYLVIYLTTRVIVCLSSKQNVLKTLLWLLPLQVSMGLFIVKSLKNNINRKYIWKGREIN